MNWIWFTSIAMAIVISTSLLLLEGWFERSRSEALLLDSLRTKANVAARRASAELLVGSESLPQVLSFFKKDMSLEDVQIVKERPACLNGPKVFECAIKYSDHIKHWLRVPYIPDSLYIELTVLRTSYLASLHLGRLWWTVLPVLGMVLVGSFLQRRFLDRFIMKPIEHLVAVASSGVETPKHWPAEIKDISDRLASTFFERDEFLLSQIATGVIHDLRSLLHSVQSATKLVTECGEVAGKRAELNELLFRACHRNIPKMSRLIESTLDGAREVQLQRSLNDLAQTIAGAAHALKAELDRAQVALEILIPKDQFFLEHDPMQTERVFLNLFKNSLEAIVELGPESSAYQTKRIRVSIESEGKEFVALRVEDSGPGLKSSYKQGLKSTKKQGIGLGILISKRIIEAHGGDLFSVPSRDLGGAAFMISLPKVNRLGEENETA